MDLVRYITIRLTRPSPHAMGQWPYRASNGIEVQVQDIQGIQRDLTTHTVLVPEQTPTVIWPYEHDQVRLLASARAEAGEPHMLGQHLEVPVDRRSATEFAIREYADVLGVSLQCKTALRSPRPCLALAPTSAAEQEQMSKAAGLAAPSSGGTSARIMPPVMPQAVSLDVFQDRMDGVALLADSLSEDSAIARARELFRLFERAFRAGPSGCVDPLTSFLQSAPRNDASKFTTAEVATWLRKLRSRATHADVRDDYARTADLAPYLSRMEYAAYDVLFNKKDWRSKSPARRQKLSPMSVPSRDNSAVSLLHPGATIMIDWLDPFGVHPTDWECSIDLKPPWVWRLPGEHDEEEPERHGDD